MSTSKERTTLKLPRMLTVKDAHEVIFSKKISMSKIYELIRTKSIPHVNANGKLLLDVDRTIEWWNNKLAESIEPVELTGLRNIV